MKVRGMTALEFLMSYGWAILIVLVVGFAIWQLGFFRSSGGGAISNGFQGLKPLLPSCKMGSDVFFPESFDYNGFTCLFKNTWGIDVQIQHIAFSVNNMTCQKMIVEYEGSAISRDCDNETAYCPDLACSGSECIQSSGPLVIPKYATFGVSVVSTQSWHVQHSNEPCWYINWAEKYSIPIDIVYSVNIGGKTVKKHSVGEIFISGEVM